MPIKPQNLTMSSKTKNTIFDEFADELLKERSDRPLIIIGTSKVDNLLFEILNLYFLPKRVKGNDSDELLEGDRPLATFSSRIKICYRLGIIDDTLCNSLERLRTLRNPSAHSIAFDITKSPVKENIAELRKCVINRRSFQLTQNRYFNKSNLNKTEELQCILLTLCVLLEAIREKTSQTKGNKHSLQIAAR